MKKTFNMVDESEVKKEFGKPFDLKRAMGRRDNSLKLFQGLSLESKTVLDVGAGHCVVAAFATEAVSGVEFDCLDFAPEFESQGMEAVKALGGDLGRVRFVTGSFYDIRKMRNECSLRDRYDYVFVHETLHHSTQKIEMLQGFHNVMDPASRLLVIEPVLPPFFADRAYAKSQWARDLGYIEDPVGKSQYLKDFEQAGFALERSEIVDMRGGGSSGWKRYLPEAVRGAYRTHVYPLYHSVPMMFVLRSTTPGGTSSLDQSEAKKS